MVLSIFSAPITEEFAYLPELGAPAQITIPDTAQLMPHTFNN